MGQYSLWLDSYSRCRDSILNSLRDYHMRIGSIGREIQERNLILPLKESKEKISASMGFVDGGEGIRELLGVIVYLIRASALLLDNESGGYKNQRFLRDLDMNILNYDEHTKERVELLRGAMEFQVAIKAIKEKAPEFLFIDGSLYVNSRKSQPQCREFSIYRKTFLRLLRLCKENSVHIVGISEDSKSRLFSNHLLQKYGIELPPSLTDSSILRIMGGNTCYRTIPFTPRPTLELSSFTVSFPTLYVQPTPLANPLRVDVPDWEQDLDRIIQLIVELSQGSRQHGYPIPLYLVHLDAKIDSKHAEWSTNQLISYLSRKDPELYDSILHSTRRACRPKL